MLTAPPPEEEPLHESCHCNLLSASDYISMIIATFGEFVCEYLGITGSCSYQQANEVDNYMCVNIYIYVCVCCLARLNEQKVMKVADHVICRPSHG